MYLLLFFYSKDQIFDAAKINQDIFTKLLIEKNDSIRELFGIKSLVILYGSYRNHNLNVPCMSKSNSSLLKCTK